MKLKIGFSSEPYEKTQSEIPQFKLSRPAEPQQSLVQVRFPGHGQPLTYFNDQFDLHPGDRVYVDGKLEGIQGRVMDVSYNFKIKLSDYKRVIALVDTNADGQYFQTDSHFVTFDPNVLPAAKALTWFMAPVQEDQFVCGSDDSSFPLDNLNAMPVSSAIAERGHDYYLDERIHYLSLDGTHGYAIVQGTMPYEVAFEYRNGEISHLTCSCYCSYNCKHEFATMLQLRELLNFIDQHYSEEHKQTDYFAAIDKATFFSIAVDGKESGSFTLA